jgi:hypothetical protein
MTTQIEQVKDKLESPVDIASIIIEQREETVAI